MANEHFANVRSSPAFSCLPHILEHQAKRIPNAPVILAPGRAPLSYIRLYQHIDEMERTLRAIGIARHDRVAVLLPNGPEMAVTILTVASSATCAPMNPAYGPEELDRYFADLRPRALIISVGTDSPARAVAISHGIRILELSTTPDAEAGLFTLAGDQQAVAPDEPARPGDVALMLFTSGTTARPKRVPMTHANICAGAHAYAASLALKESDRCLNVLPLFHGHGVVATLLNSLTAGASVVCTPGCDVNSFFGWLASFRPTWYSAVPTMHQAILARARQNGERVVDCGLRFIRSASAPLPPTVFAELEQTFGAPVVELYGMTETGSSAIACNPLPPRRRKVGSVGIPVGLDVAIIGEAGAFLPAGKTGEVVVRGASVMSGYDSDPMANQAAFVGDWFRTGDHGFFDEDGYLVLVGRKQEIINRGGEKFAPREVDEVLLEHPAVAEAATFAVPHPTLGEDVASAVILRPDMRATSSDIRQFTLGRLADFKVPRQVHIVDQLPKGPTGKVQRVGLAAKLGLASVAVAQQGFVAPRTYSENMLAKFWAEILHVERVGIHDNFFALGGDSLSAVHVLARISDILHREIGASRIFEMPTVAEMARHLDTLTDADRAQGTSAIMPVPRQHGVRATAAQERLLKLQKALPEIPFCNIVYALRLTSPVDAFVLERSINEIVRRHESLRTTFAVVDSRYVQIIASQLNVPVIVDDLRKLPKSRKETATTKLLQHEFLHSFDLAHGPLIRARLLRLAEQEYLLLMTMNQTVVDGWSLGVFVEELAALYEAFTTGTPSPLAPLSIQFSDFAQWQRDWPSHPDMVAQLAYWREQLKPPLPVMKLATARARRTIDNFRTARRETILPADLAEAARRFSHGEGGTLFMVLVAAFKALLHRYLGQEDLRVATNVANRNRPGTEGLIGRLTNTVILRTELRGDPSARELLRQVRATTLAAFVHQDFPFGELAEAFASEGSAAPPVLAQAMITLQSANLRPRANDAHGLAFEEANPNMLTPLVTITSYDIILMLREDPQGLIGTCVYKPALFGARTIDLLLRDFQKVLEQMVAQPDRPIAAIRVSRQKAKGR
jgi:acyl-CoA synthetase (AMP-forming)/AMP-acid ligase II/acyl carrier protein